jgi:tRNA (cytidine/uridine-2'-O-)-methyltransferase
MLHVALWEPEVPPNTGNVARLCAATGARLHLIGRLGFRLDDKSLKRAGLDYWPAVDLARHVTFAEFEAAVLSPPPRGREPNTRAVPPVVHRQPGWPALHAGRLPRRRLSPVRQ